MGNEKKEDRFTEEQLIIIKEAVNKWIKDYHCEICKNTNWLIDPFMVNLPVTNKVVVTLGGSVLPLLPITCSKCGNTHLLNLSILGLTEMIKGKEDKK